MRATATRLVLASIFLLIAVPLASAQKAYEISPSYIAGAKLGWTQTQYKALLGTPRVDRLEGGYTRLVWAKRKLEAYLVGGKGVALVTSNKQHVDELGVTPCSTIATLESAWGHRLVVIRLGGRIVGYRLGKLVYAREGKRVSSVMLADSKKRDFIAFNAPACR